MILICTSSANFENTIFDELMFENMEVVRFVRWHFNIVDDVGRYC